MDKYELFRKNHKMTKYEVLEDISDTLEKILKRAETDPSHSYAYYSTLKSLLDDFRKEIESVILMDKLEDGWCYDWGVTFNGAEYQLIHYNVYDEYLDDPRLIELDQVYTLFTVSTHLLTVDEFAALHGIEEVTVRQWIRRGKIRTAKKFGNEWRIPALTDAPKRGYTSARYSWSDSLAGLPDDLKFLNDYIEALFTQDEEDKKLYYVQLYDEKPSEGMIMAAKTLECTSTEREKIELALISQPTVTYHPNFRDNICIDLMNIYSAEEDNRER